MRVVRRCKRHVQEKWPFRRLTTQEFNCIVGMSFRSVYGTRNNYIFVKFLGRKSGIVTDLAGPKSVT